MKSYDCIVVGGWPAGLSASLFLARYLHSTLTFHHNSPRNEYTHGIHGFLGHHDISPAGLLSRGRSEVTLHGGLIVEACVTDAEKVSADRFRFSAERQGLSETFETRRLLLATGLRDLTPDCIGFRQSYATGVHHCPDCDGYETKDKRIVVLGGGRKTVGFALSLLTWTNRVTLITGGDAGDMTADDRVKLANLDIHIIDRSIIALEGNLESNFPLPLAELLLCRIRVRLLNRKALAFWNQIRRKVKAGHLNQAANYQRHTNQKLESVQV